MSFSPISRPHSSPDEGYRNVPLMELLIFLVAFIITTSYMTQEIGFLFSFLGNLIIYGGIMYLKYGQEE